MYRIPFSDINTLFDTINGHMNLYLPVEKNNAVNFSKYENGVKYAYDALNTVKSAKDFFFPQTENIAEFKISGKKIDIIEGTSSDGDFAVFGVRECDFRSFEILDRVFMSEPSDPYWSDRRNRSTVITTACANPENTCFCTSFGIEPWNPAGDVSTFISDNFLYWQDNTEKGRNLTEKIKNILTECDSSEISECKNNIKNICENLPYGRMSLEKIKNTDEKELFNSEVWKSLSASCIGCGTCTFACPTCQCYDIRDFDSGKSVIRFRCWDSCMYSDFTKMAHGNPRKTQTERFRQRFMHKLKYYPENNDGIFSCVGCGRCVTKCPVSMNMIKVIKALGGDCDD